MDNQVKDEILEEMNKMYKSYYIRFKERVCFLERLFNQDLIEDEYVKEVIKAENYIEKKIDSFKRKIIFYGQLNNLNLSNEAEDFSFNEKCKLGLIK